MYSIDLHIHSSYSDGTLTPFQIIDEAIKNNVKIISIADHDTLDAYSEEVMLYAKQQHIELIPGVEISTHYNKYGFHVLGYHIDLHNQEFREMLYSLKNARKDYLINVSQKLRELGYHIDEKDFDTIDIVTKAHIAKNIVNNKQNEELLLKQFSYIPKSGEFIETIMNEDCPAYVKKKTLSPMEASEFIKKAGGTVILAHPVCYQYEDGTSDSDIIELTKKMKADGIEAVYIYIDRNNHKINDIHKWKQMALQHNLKITIGSDFHSFDSIHPCIGLINEDIQTDFEGIEKIIHDLNI